jgi:hypothetical protein
MLGEGLRKKQARQTAGETMIQDNLQQGVHDDIAADKTPMVKTPADKPQWTTAYCKCGQSPNGLILDVDRRM